MEPESERRGPRRRTLRAAKAVYGDFRYVTDCVIRDVSEGGARLKSPTPAEIPEEFYLYEPADAMLRQVRVVWRKNNEIGVTFEGPPISVYDAKDPRLARFRHM